MQNNRIHDLERNKMKIEEEFKEAVRKVSRLQTELGDSQNETLSYSQYLEVVTNFRPNYILMTLNTCIFLNYFVEK